MAVLIDPLFLVSLAVLLAIASGAVYLLWPRTEPHDVPTVPRPVGTIYSSICSDRARHVVDLVWKDRTTLGFRKPDAERLRQVFVLARRIGNNDHQINESPEDHESTVCHLPDSSRRNMSQAVTKDSHEFPRQLGFWRPEGGSD